VTQHIFVYEYLTASGAGAGTSLETEGRAMLSAVLADFRRAPGLCPVTLPGGDDPRLFRQLVRQCDFSLVIAPEPGGLLAERCRWVEEAGGRLLGPGRAAVALAADKLELARWLRAAGVPTPICVPLSEPIDYPAVCKPRHGAGSQATFLVPTPEKLPDCLAEARAEGWEGELVLQPHVSGTPVSVAFLLGPRQEMALAPVLQRLSNDGRFHYEGGTVPLAEGLAARAVRLAWRAVRAVPGLRGYVGVDLVLGDAEDGSSDRVIEINPRLTTSFVGLRALAAGNLMETLVRVVSGEPVAQVEWQPGVVDFGPDGAVGKK
jgi:predicted ATP-grasp superfamily ATP-dependent carboligase